MATATRGLSPSIPSITRATASAIAVSAITNGGLYFIASTGGLLPVASTMGDVTIAPVLMMTIIPGIVAALLYYVLHRLLTRRRANQVFLVVVLLVVVGMAFSPFMNIIEPSLGTILILEMMHLIVALPVVYFLLQAE